MSLLKHESWQVRAEAAVGIGKLSDRIAILSALHRRDGKAGCRRRKLQVDAYVALARPAGRRRRLRGGQGGRGACRRRHGRGRRAAGQGRRQASRSGDQRADDAGRQGRNMRAEGDSALAEVLQARGAAGAGGGHRRALQRRLRRRGRGTAGGARRQEERSPHRRGRCAWFKLLEGVRGQAASKVGESPGRHLRGKSVVLDRGEPVWRWPRACCAGVYQADRPPQSPSRSDKPTPATEAKDAEEKDKPDRRKSRKKKRTGWDQWLEECYAGRHRPKWTAEWPRRPWKRCSRPRRRRSGWRRRWRWCRWERRTARCPSCSKHFSTNPELLETARQVLPWLVWEQRLKTFQRLPPVGHGRGGVCAADRRAQRSARPPRGRAACGSCWPTRK